MATILSRNKNIGKWSLKSYHLHVVLRRPWSWNSWFTTADLTEMSYYYMGCYLKHQHFRIYGHLCIGGSMLLGKRFNSNFKQRLLNSGLNSDHEDLSFIPEKAVTSLVQLFFLISYILTYTLGKYWSHQPECQRQGRPTEHRLRKWWRT